MPTINCPNCANPVDSQQLFCPECGTRITASLPPSDGPTQALTPPPGQSQWSSPQQPSGAPYPPPGQSYPPPGQQPPGQAYPPPGQSYPPPGQAYPPPGQNYAGYPQPGAQPAKKSNLPLIIGGLVVLLLLGGAAFALSQSGGTNGNGSVAAGTTEPTERATPRSSRATPRPTREPTEEPAEETETPDTGPDISNTEIVADTFVDKRERWPEQETVNGAYQYVDGAYQIRVDDDERILWTSTDTKTPYTDLNARIEVTFIEGPENNAAGLTLREQDEGGMYAFQVRPDGSYAFRRLDRTDADSEWTSIIDWKTSEAINTGLNASNKLEVRAVGPTFTLLINDQEVDVASDETYPEGAVGFGASSFEQGGTVAEFDNLEVVEP